MFAEFGRVEKNRYFEERKSSSETEATRRGLPFRVSSRPPSRSQPPARVSGFPLPTLRLSLPFVPPKTNTMGYAGYAPGHKVVELTVLQQLLKQIKSDKSLETLEKLTRNSAQAPGEEKFRKVGFCCRDLTARATPRHPNGGPGVRTLEGRSDP
mgnify:CR=1 FL=1